MLKNSTAVKSYNLPQKANSFYEKIPNKISTWDRGWPITMSMRKLKSARTKYFNKKYEIALKNINNHITSNITDNPYGIGHEKSLPPFLYYQAYHLKALCLIELKQWQEALTFATNALIAARMVFIDKSKEVKELETLRAICNKNELINSQPTTTPAFFNFTKEESESEESSSEEETIANRVAKRRKVEPS